MTLHAATLRLAALPRVGLLTDVLLVAAGAGGWGKTQELGWLRPALCRASRQLLAQEGRPAG